MYMYTYMCTYIHLKYHTKENERDLRIMQPYKSYCDTFNCDDLTYKLDFLKGLQISVKKI